MTHELTDRTTVHVPSSHAQRPLAHGTCHACQTDRATALAFCGHLAWPPEGDGHVCDHPTFSCGCQPCNVCLALHYLPCERCGDPGLPIHRAL